MTKTGLLLVFHVILSEATTQTTDSVMPSSAPVIIQYSKSTSPSTCTNSKWEELLPALQMIKNTSNIKKEKLFNVVKIINFLLSDEFDNKQSESAKMLEEIKEKMKEPEDMLQNLSMPNLDSILEERQKSSNEVIDDTYMLDKLVMMNKTAATKNVTADYSRILSKINAALAKFKEQNQSSETQTPVKIPICRPKNVCTKKFNPPLIESQRQLGNSVSTQTGTNPMSSLSMFNIPCQRASDILEETASFRMPRDALCDNSVKFTLNTLAKNSQFNLENLPCSNIVPNSISQVDSDDTVAILFKPKTISLMQLYGKLLKKITITALVPFYISKLAI